jgi:ATP-dependent DNA helicase DinG
VLESGDLVRLLEHLRRCSVELRQPLDDLRRRLPGRLLGREQPAVDPLEPPVDPLVELAEPPIEALLDAAQPLVDEGASRTCEDDECGEQRGCDDRDEDGEDHEGRRAYLRRRTTLRRRKFKTRKRTGLSAAKKHQIRLARKPAGSDGRTLWTTRAGSQGSADRKNALGANFCPSPASLSLGVRLRVRVSAGRSWVASAHVGRDRAVTAAARHRLADMDDVFALEVFAPGGTLAGAMTGYEPRAEQAELAEAVADALAAGEHLLAEAGTGTGKSLAYLVPALASGRKVVVATATKALQEQLVTNDVPIAARVLGRDVKVAVLKGRQNYLCRKALHGFALLGGQLLQREQDAEAFDRLRPWFDETETGDRAELEFEPPDTLWNELAVGADGCLGRKCPFVTTCFSEAARRRARAADLVIVNHALYFADLGLREETDASILPEHEAVVLDEAHRLEDTAASWLGGSVSVYGLSRLERDIGRACLEAGIPVPVQALDRVRRAGGSLIRSVAPPAGRRRLREPPLAKGRVLVERLSELAAALAGANDELDLLALRTRGTAAHASACLDADELDRVVWAEPGALGWAPVDVSRRLREALWEGGPTAILVSATLTTEGDFGFVRDRLGLRGAREFAVGSPFDYSEQALLHLPRGLPDPRSPGAVDRIAEEAADLCELSSGRALVLTSSYRTLEAVADRLRATLGHELLVQGEAPRERLLERFREDVSSVLVATGTFWQGVDVPGEALSLLVIDKLPFQPPDDPLVEARCERITAEGGDWFGSYALPSAVLQLRQGFGRLIRSRSDRGVICLLDPRVRTRPYGRAFLDSLPPCRVAEDRAAVCEFLAAGAAVAS